MSLTSIKEFLECKFEILSYVIIVNLYYYINRCVLFALEVDCSLFQFRVPSKDISAALPLSNIISPSPFQSVLT